MKRFTTFLLALGIIALLAWNSGGFFFQRPYYEYWDSAANSLSVLRAKHFAQLYGPYSRYNFDHPGPAFFYVYALGEWLFYDVWHVVPSPFQGQLLINLCLVTGFYVAALSVFAQWLPERGRWSFLCVALILGIVHFSMMKNLPSYDVLDSPSAFLSVWPIHPMVLPFLCLLTAGASVGAGRGQHLPLMVLAGGFLVVHVAQPLFVGPTGVIAYFGLVVCCALRQRAGTGDEARREKSMRRGWLLAAWREYPPAHILAGIFFFLFLLPMLIDLCWGKQSNFAAILQHLHEGAKDRKSLTRSITYFLQFGAYAPYQANGRLDFGHYDRSGFMAYLRAHALLYAGWLAVLLLVLQAPFVYLWTLARRRAALVPAALDDTRQFLAWAAVLATLNIVLTLYWGTRQDERMYYYLSWTNFAIYYFGLLIAVAVLCGWRLAPFTVSGAEAQTGTAGRRLPIARLVGVGALILTGYLCADRLRIHEYDPEGTRAMHASIERAMIASDTTHPSACKVLLVPDGYWPMAAAAALQLARGGEPFIVSAGRWKNVYGAQYNWESLNARALRNGLIPWYITTQGASRPGVPADAPVFPLTNGAQLMLTAPLLPMPAAGGTADIDFVLNGNATNLALAGWAAPEPFGTWSEQKWAVLAFHPQIVAGTGVEVLVDGVPYLAPAHGLTQQRVYLFFNGTSIGPEQQLSAGGSVPFTIPAAIWNAAAAKANPVASLAFELPDAVSPAALDPSAPNGDPRTLGLFFQKLRLRVKP